MAGTKDEASRIADEVASVVDVFANAASNHAGRITGAPIQPESYTPPSVDGGGAGSVAVGNLGGAGTADKPDAPDIQIQDPDLPPEVSANNVTRYQEPAFEGDTGVDFDVITAVPEPANLQAIDWGEAPGVTVPTVPTAPTVVEPTTPTVGGYTTPTFAGLNPIDFTIAFEDFDLPTDIQRGVDYASVMWEGAELAALMADALEIIQGRMAIANHIWDSILSRTQGNLSRQEVTVLHQARKTNANRGFFMPGSFERLRLAQQEINEKRSQAIGESEINQAKLQNEDFWKATQVIQAGSQLLMQAHDSHQGRLLQLAVAVSDAEVKYYQALVAGLNALNAKVDAQVKIKEMELRGELSKLEVYKGELEAAKLESDIDRNKVALYSEQWKGQLAKVQTYTAEIEALKATVQAQATAVSAYGEEVKAKQTIVQAWATEWEAYTRRMEKPKLELAIQSAKAASIKDFVALYGARVDGEKARVSADIESAKLDLQADMANQERYKVLWQGIDTKAKALTSIYDSEVRAYTAEGQLSLGNLNAQIENRKVSVDAARLQMEASAETVKAAVAAYEAYSRAVAGWNSALMGAISQVSASAYSASNVNLSAGGSFSGSYNNSYSHNLSRSYGVNVSVPIDEASGVDISPPNVQPG